DPQVVPQKGAPHAEIVGKNGSVPGMSVFELHRHNALASAIVATIREPLIILDRGFHVVAASGAFYRLFQVEAAATQHCPLHELNGGQWNVPGLRKPFETVFRGDMLIEGYELEMDLPDIGRRRILLNARLVLEQERSEPALLLVALEDVTARYEADRLKDLLLVQQKTLLLEFQHRVGNSLQIIESILMLKMRAAISEEIRDHLRDAYQRVIAMATVQQKLHESDLGGAIDIGRYLS